MHAKIILCKNCSEKYQPEIKIFRKKFSMWILWIYYENNILLWIHNENFQKKYLVLIYNCSSQSIVLEETNSSCMSILYEHRGRGQAVKCVKQRKQKSQNMKVKKTGTNRGKKVSGRLIAQYHLVLDFSVGESVIALTKPPSKNSSAFRISCKSAEEGASPFLCK